MAATTGGLHDHKKEKDQFVEKAIDSITSMAVREGQEALYGGTN